MTCPACGGEPTEESVRAVQLAACGYRQSASYECGECGETWV